MADPLHAAIRTGSRDALLDAIKGGADVNGFDASLPWRPLHRAIIHGQAEFIEILLRAGADVHLGDRKGRKPICTALKNGALELAELLRAHGADLRKSERDGLPLMHQLIAECHPNHTNDPDYPERMQNLLAGINWVIENDPEWDRADEHGVHPLTHASKIPQLAAGISSAVARNAMRNVAMKTSTRGKP